MDIFTFAKNGDVNEVINRLNEGFNINDKNSKQLSILHIASYNGYIELVKLLLKKGANINVHGINKETPLIIALCNNHLEVIKILLEYDANVNAEDEDGTAVLQYAIMHVDDLNIIKKIIEKGADINAGTNLGITALHLASQIGNIELVKLLLENGADVNAEDEDCSTPLRYASKKGHKEIVKRLLENGAEIDDYILDNIESFTSEIQELLIPEPEDEDCSTPIALHYASKKGHKELVKLLLEKGAKIDDYILDNMGSFTSEIQNLLIPEPES